MNVSLLLCSDSGLILEVVVIIVGTECCIKLNGALREATVSKIQSVSDFPWNSLEF